MTALDVIEGREQWSVEQGDLLRWLPTLPTDSVDLVMCSPPYEDARLYIENGENLGVARDTDEWVAWMLDVVKACLRVCKGLCVFVVEGRTNNYRYSGGPILLWADLIREGICTRKAPIYRRVGIPGSGGPDWWRNDTEACICFTRGGKLPWSDNTATGAPPKYDIGGAMSNRTKTGERINGRSGTRNSAAKTITRISGMTYSQPELANPGNILDAPPSIGVFERIILHYAKLTKTDPVQVVRELRRATDSQAEKQWLVGVCSRILSAEVLQPFMCQPEAGGATSDDEQLSMVWDDANEEDPPFRRHGVVGGRSGTEVLQPALHGEPRGTQRGKADLCGECGAQQGAAEEEARRVRAVRGDVQTGSASQGQRPDQQRAGESGSPVRTVPQGAPQGDKDSQDVFRLRGQDVCARTLQQALPALQEAWRPVLLSLRSALSTSAARSDVIDCGAVGGGNIGSLLSHLNEAPYPEDLVAPFVRSFCPPGGIVLDPFAGSGTTLAVALKWGRRAIGCDLRQSQVDLTTKRIKAEAIDLFTGMESQP